MGAKYTSEDIQPDEVIQPNLDFDYDAKRDRCVCVYQLVYGVCIIMYA